MKKKLIAALAAIAFTATVQAQTNSPTQPASFWGGIGTALSSIGISSNPTNYAAAPFVGFSTSGNQLAAGLLVVENVNNNVGVIAGFDHLWFGGHTGSANIVSGGLTLKQPTHPLTWLGTNAWEQNFTLTPYAVAMVGAAFGNTGNSGGGMAGIARGGFNFDIVNISGWELGAGIDYGNRTGSGAYNGNWIDGTINIRKGF